MGVKERKKREKEERRRVILEKTRQLIIENGLYGFSMQDIASAAELNKATLYLYFKNKGRSPFRLAPGSRRGFRELSQGANYA